MSCEQRDELAGLIVRAKGGDQQAMALLWESVRGMAHKEASRRAKHLPGVEADDLVQESYFGFARAVERYNHELGIRFGTFVCHCMRNAIADHLRRERRRALPQADGDGVDELLADGPPVDDGPAGEAMDVKVLLRGLNRRDRQAVEMHFGLTDGEPRTNAEVGKALGISHQRASFIVERALNRMREEYGSELVAA